MLKELKNLRKQGKQYIPDVNKMTLPDTFRGLPVIKAALSSQEIVACAEVCPTDAIVQSPVFGIDMGRCTFCKECHFACPEKIVFSNNYKTAALTKEDLIITEIEKNEVSFDATKIRKEIVSFFGQSLTLRQISAGGDHSAEWELGAAGNPNFDMGRYGIHFTASPRHSDGLVITGAITENMAAAVKNCIDATSDPKIIVVVGHEAISGGIFADSPAIVRDVFDLHPPDLFVPGNPPHPATFINGILSLIRGKRF